MEFWFIHLRILNIQSSTHILLHISFFKYDKTPQQHIGLSGPLLFRWAECPPCRSQVSSLYRVEAGREFQWESIMHVPGYVTSPASGAFRRTAHICRADDLGILELSCILPRLLVGQMKEPVALEIKVKMLVSDWPKSPFPMKNFRVCWF